jgi:hypothetical protein
MSDHAFFSPRAIRANEEAVRKSFAARAGDGALDLCKSRIGQRVGPASIRAAIEEVNRGTPPEIYQPAFLSLIGWQLANTVAALTDPEERMKALGRALALVQIEAFAFAAGNDVVETPDAAHGEIVGGHA